MSRPRFRFLMRLLCCSFLAGGMLGHLLMAQKRVTPTNRAVSNTATPNNAASNLADAPPGEPSLDPEDMESYVLGPEDRLTVWALGADEISDKIYPVGSDGKVDFPLVGEIEAAGLTAGQLKDELVSRLRTHIREPLVSITVTEFGSQPATVMGAVAKPGVYQLRGRRTLVEVLSMAGGLSAEAGYTARVTRSLKWGPIPIDTAENDAGKGFSVAEISLQSLLEARDPAENIVIRPNDVITIPRGELVYAIGNVKVPGGFVLREQESMSVLQVLAMCQGLDVNAGGSNARILRAAASDNAPRTEIPVDLKKIMEGKARDVRMHPEDILFVPSSTAKTITRTIIDTATRTITGLIIWRR